MPQSREFPGSRNPMTLKRPKGPAGTLLVLEHSSKILKDNPLRDPHVRKLGVWLPPQYDDGSKRRFPVLYDLVGFTGSGLAHTNWRPFGDNVPERAARLIREQKMGPAIIVFPDCFTALGGNQYVNSSAIGDYADYLTREIVPFVDREFRTLAAREHRGCFGKSSGGYGAILHGMKYAKTRGIRRTPRVEPQGPRRRAGRRAHTALSCARGEEGKAHYEGDPLHHERLHGRHLRSGSEGAARLPRAVQPRIGRGDRGALAQVAPARPDQSRNKVSRQPEVAARHLHRLRLARPVPHPLRLAHPLRAPRRGANPAPLRGIRRRPLRRRLPHG